ncbi:MAG: type I DNA topoisomerase [Rhodothermaceae bacterium]|nr:type I DNA topoisomerase [Rhodothermaceae bacterium]
MKRLVVVESPTKARTISKYLPQEQFRVEASMGHVRDLPASASQIPESVKGKSWARLGVNVEDGFEPLYVIPPDKKKIVRELKTALKDADELFIATDEDREGESIGWHLVQVLNPKIPVRRMVFHEITQEAILNALDNTREIDHNLIDAQETRRILDRLVGYSISPLLWRKIKPKLSAGRVQSVAVRLIVHRERERMAFVPASYWDLKAKLEQKGQLFDATLSQYKGLRIATGRDFDDETGQLKSSLKEGKDVLLLSEKEARELAARLPEDTWKVASVEERTVKRSPAPPFITSTLQQEASRKLKLSARDTMRVAQNLYEQGYITYMRTDSTNLSKEAVEASQNAVVQRYGEEYLHPGTRNYSSSVRNAQEAHEAIRPAGNKMLSKADLNLTGIEGALYDLIWKRTVASQMKDARLRLSTVLIDVGPEDEVARFKSNGRRVEFPGFFRAYVEGSDDPEAAIEDRDQPLPELAEGDQPDCKEVEPVGHETKPPARYTEASLIKTLEKQGIGRPSTYATIIDTIISRGYIKRRSNQLVPTFTAFATTNLLEQEFQQLVDVGFTAGMEQVLDDIASGATSAKPYLDSFYQGKDGLESRVEGGLDKIDARLVSTITSSKWGEYLVRVGRYGPYVELEKNGERLTAALPEDVAPADLTQEDLARFVEQGNEDDVVVGIHPEEELPILIRKGPYGPYIQLGDDEQEGKPKRISLPKGVLPQDVDLEKAVGLISLPRTVGSHPESGEDVKAHIGRYGPYVQHRKVYASLAQEDDVLTVGMERALELLAKKEGKSKAVRTIGNHPESGEPLDILEGRYGPYIKYQKINASLPKGTEIEAVTMEQALELIAAKAAAKGKGRKRKTTRKKK